MYIPHLAPLISLLTTIPPSHPPAEQNVTAYLYARYPGPPTTSCHNLREGMCCGASDPHTYPRVEFVGLSDQDTAIGWGTRAVPIYGFCGDIIVATASAEPDPALVPKSMAMTENGKSNMGKGKTSGHPETPTSRNPLARRRSVVHNEGGERSREEDDITVLTATPGRLSAVSWESQREKVGHEDDQRRGIWSMVWRGKMRIGLRRSEFEMAPKVWERPRTYP